MTIPLSRLVELARAHGGRYSRRGRGRWPWGSPHVPESRRDDTCNCSTLSLAVICEAFGATPTLTEHRLWMIDTAAMTDESVTMKQMEMGPVAAAGRMGITARRGSTLVEIMQGWTDVPLRSAGHTWIEVDTDDGVRVIDATPSKPWRGPRVMAPRPMSWARRWTTLYRASLDVDRHR